MTINESKTKVIWFASSNMRKPLPDLSLKMNGKHLAKVTHYMYLGAELDSNTVSKVSNKVFKLGELESI